MARPALRKIDPTLDLSKHLLALDQLPVPWDETAVFARGAPLEVEVGTGKGLFVITASGERPEHNFLGCEIAHKYARLAAARLARAGRSNAVVVDGDALQLFRVHLPNACAAAVHTYFPDPWWKQRHRKRRVLTPVFLADIERVLRPEGTFHFWTDVKEYFDTTLALIAKVTRLLGPFEVAQRPAEHDLDFRTHFERRTRLHNEAVFRAEFRRVAT
ncbi:MAG: tRNA (guanosine(46)-N7)-methyltransferase TrmB [Candidatus Anammoximicrobium sp.]|nr:tRNA (guanosine(46)-N7)-methyltransferase TrmB [Candidatus Anammoximicrobium sp.]